MDIEHDSLMKKHTWDLVPLPNGKNLVRYKWVLKIKITTTGQVEKHKTQLVAKGFFLHKEGIDYAKIFSPNARMNTTRNVIYFVASFQWELHRICANVFLNGDLHEEIYM